MAFTEKYLPVSRQQYFTFFATGITSMDETFNPGWPFELDKIRVHLSTIHLSVVDFIVLVSHHLGSQYNHLLLSQAMSDVNDLIYQPSSPLIMHHNDTILLSMVMTAANVFGLEVAGWAVTIAP